MLNTLIAQVELSPQNEFANLSTITVEGIIIGAVGLILVVAAIVFLFMLIIGGIKWITSGGDKAQTESARNTITAALIGLVIIFAAWAIITLVGQLFGLDNIFSLELPTFEG